MRGDKVVDANPVLQNQNSNNLEKKHKLQELHTPNYIAQCACAIFGCKKGANYYSSTDTHRGEAGCQGIGRNIFRPLC